VLDYRKEDVATRINEITQGAGVDRIVEVAFGRNLPTDSAVIKQNGVIASYGSDADPYPQLPFYELMRKDITLRLTLVYIIPIAAREQGIVDVNTALEAGALRPVIASQFPLRETALAHQAVESGQMIGNVVVKVD
jgi:NADPH:quinone reductase